MEQTIFLLSHSIYWRLGVTRRCRSAVSRNADYTPEYLARVRSVDKGYMSIPFADDVELSMRLA